MKKELTFKKPQKKPDGYTLLPTGAKLIRVWKPNLFQRFAYCIGMMQDPRYNGKKMSYYHFDEVGQMPSKHL
jgi:hypothetical protein